MAHLFRVIELRAMSLLWLPSTDQLDRRLALENVVDFPSQYCRIRLLRLSAFAQSCNCGSQPTVGRNQIACSVRWAWSGTPLRHPHPPVMPNAKMSARATLFHSIPPLRPNTRPIPIQRSDRITPNSDFCFLVRCLHSSSHNRILIF